MLVTNPCTNDARVLKEAKSLAENGYDVTIHAIAKNGIANFEKKDGFQIKRLNRVFKANSILGKLEFTIRSVPLLVKQNADIYHAHDCSTLLECYIASRIKRSKLVYDSHELYIRNYGNKSFGEKIYSLIEKRLIKKANKIITVNEFIARKLQDRYNLSTEIVVLMNAPVFEKNEKNYHNNNLPNDIIATNKKAGKKIIIYQGVMQKGRGLSTLIQSMKYLENYFLLMVGDGQLRDSLEYLVKEKRLKNIYFTGMVNHSLLFEYTRMADLGVILFENNSLNNYYASPNKLFEYIHCNIPILAPNYPFIRSIIEKYKVGVLIDNIEPDQVASAIHNIFSEENVYLEMRSNTELAKKDLNWQIEEKKLLDLYRKL